MEQTNQFLGKKDAKVKIILYRWEGQFLFYKIKTDCAECDINTGILKDMMAKEFKGKSISLAIKPWLDNWYIPIVRGGWHAPIVTLNGKVFSQEKVIKRQELREHVLKML